MYPRWPYILPPGTPNEIVSTLRGAMVKAFKDPEFPKEYKKLLAAEPTPLTGEEVQSAIKGLPRDPEIVGLYKRIAEGGPLPSR
jgi:tripartite-type tricarboxylate transporter receptor subunit TctC